MRSLRALRQSSPPGPPSVRPCQAPCARACRCAPAVSALRFAPGLPASSVFIFAAPRGPPPFFLVLAPASLGHLIRPKLRPAGPSPSFLGLLRASVGGPAAGRRGPASYFPARRARRSASLRSGPAGRGKSSAGPAALRAAASPNRLRNIYHGIRFCSGFFSSPPSLRFGALVKKVGFIPILRNRD